MDSRNVPFLSERSSCDRAPKGCEWETIIEANPDSDPPTPDLTCLPLSSWGKLSPLPQKVVKGTMVVQFHRFFNGRNTVYLKHCQACSPPHPRPGRSQSPSSRHWGPVSPTSGGVHSPIRISYPVEREEALLFTHYPGKIVSWVYWKRLWVSEHGWKSGDT